MTVENAVEGAIRPSTENEVDWREVLAALRAVRGGDFEVRLPRSSGLSGEVADAFNDVTDPAGHRNRELMRISRVVGREGRVTERLDEEGYEGGVGRGHPGHQQPDRRPGPADHRDRPRHRGGGRG